MEILLQQDSFLFFFTLMTNVSRSYSARRQLHSVINISCSILSNESKAFNAVLLWDSVCYLLKKVCVDLKAEPGVVGL